MAGIPEPAAGARSASSPPRPPPPPSEPPAARGRRAAATAADTRQDPRPHRRPPYRLHRRRDRPRPRGSCARGDPPTARAAGRRRCRAAWARSPTKRCCSPRSRSSSGFLLLPLVSPERASRDADGPAALRAHDDVLRAGRRRPRSTTAGSGATAGVRCRRRRGDCGSSTSTAGRCRRATALVRYRGRLDRAGRRRSRRTPRCGRAASGRYAALLLLRSTTRGRSSIRTASSCTTASPARASSTIPSQPDARHDDPDDRAGRSRCRDECVFDGFPARRRVALRGMVRHVQRVPRGLRAHRGGAAAHDVRVARHRGRCGDCRRHRRRELSDARRLPRRRSACISACRCRTSPPSRG